MSNGFHMTGHCGSCELPPFLAPVRDRLKGAAGPHLLDYQFDQAVDRFIHVGRVESVGNAGPDEFPLSVRDDIETRLNAYLLFFLQVSRSVDHGIYPAVVTIK